jgi:hypothetical protein
VIQTVQNWSIVVCSVIRMLQMDKHCKVKLYGQTNYEVCMYVCICLLLQEQTGVNECKYAH